MKEPAAGANIGKLVRRLERETDQLRLMYGNTLLENDGLRRELDEQREAFRIDECWVAMVRVHLDDDGHNDIPLGVGRTGGEAQRKGLAAFEDLKRRGVATRASALTVVRFVGGLPTYDVISVTQTLEGADGPD